MLYIFLFLHQTATIRNYPYYVCRCISSYSYIKPQHTPIAFGMQAVVYLLIPTSNRNCSFALYSSKVLYIFLFLHQTATVVRYQPLSVSCISSYSYIKPQLSFLELAFFELYIFLFLHQTATTRIPHSERICCISSYSYIKPQLAARTLKIALVVYLLIPTSNRNFILITSCI